MESYENMIAVSVIMPSLNVANYIEECIQSVVNQTLKEIEIICIDAGSTDGTWELLQKYAAIDHRIQLVHSDIKSYGAQVNQGISMAKGKYVAIVETDDYISPEMYETLYAIAERENVDYVKADFNSFYTLRNGEKIIQGKKQFGDMPELYNKVLNPHTMEIIYERDRNLWRGIYERKFLNDNKIVLMESQGAAYQDIGFMEQVLINARSAYYTEDYLYFYRTDREDASTYSIQGLRNTYVEFKQLYDEYVKDSGKVYMRGYSLHMASAFLGEYEKTLIKMDYDYLAPECKSYYQWFKEYLIDALNNRVICESDFNSIQYKKLRLLLEDENAFANMIKEENARKQKRVSLMKFDTYTEVVIWGAGFCGCELLKELDVKDNVKVVAFADNAENKMNRTIAGVSIWSLKTCLQLFPHAVFIIANEVSCKEMEKQYVRERGSRELLLVGE